ncbi:glycosyltransferase family 25 protein [Hyphomicrobium sp. 99]|uniref:glycosyltransferase family 25 protein n=1 Tax=Hyphomicrobium sp. 99 TaxID=1163419 RepID=UPI0005F89642|nr:glycosyltransferase family 25 protein [Hyphomicrobium sp. 99]
MSVAVYYINRDCDHDRRNHIEAELARAGIQATRLSAVDGVRVPDWLVPYYRDSRLTPGEVGCSASHLSICARIRDEKLPCAVVLEDDAILPIGFLEIVRAALAVVPSDWDIIRMVRRPTRGCLVIDKIDATHNLIRYPYVPYGTAAIIVSASGAKKLLTQRSIVDAIDHEVRRPWSLDLNVYGIDPPPVTELSRELFPSTIVTRTRKRSNYRFTRTIFNVRKLGMIGYLRSLKF